MIKTIIYGKEDIFAYHKYINQKRIAIVVDKNGEEVNVVFPEGEIENKVFDYGDWLELHYFKGDKNDKKRSNRKG